MKEPDMVSLAYKKPGRKGDCGHRSSNGAMFFGNSED
jgi:hypothetical protein